MLSNENDSGASNNVNAPGNAGLQSDEITKSVVSVVSNNTTVSRKRALEQDKVGEDCTPHKASKALAVSTPSSTSSTSAS